MLAYGVITTPFEIAYENYFTGIGMPQAGAHIIATLIDRVLDATAVCACRRVAFSCSFFALAECGPLTSAHERQ